MEEDSESEGEDDGIQKRAQSPTDNATGRPGDDAPFVPVPPLPPMPPKDGALQLPPLPPNPDQVLIRKDYNPKGNYCCLI